MLLNPRIRIGIRYELLKAVVISVEFNVLKQNWTIE